MVRYSKHQMNRWLNGEEHWLYSGKDYWDWEAPEDVVRKLRNAAWYRGIVAQIRIYPDRIWILASEPLPGEKAPQTYNGLKHLYQVLQKDYLDLRRDHEQLKHDLEEKIRELNTLIEDVINGS